MITVDRAYLVGFGLEALVYGVYIVVFSMSMAFLLWRRKTPDVNWPMVGTTVILFVGGSLHFWWSFQRTIEAFIDRRNEKGGPGRVVVGAAFQLPIDAMFSVNNFLGDSLLIYRCWLVWNQNWYIIIAPILLLLVSIASSAVGLYQIAHLGDVGLLLTESVRRFGFASFIISLCLNAVLTLLIAGRIWNHARRTKRVFQDRSLTAPYTAVVGIVIESGFIFFVVQAIFVGLWEAHNLASTAVTLPAAQIYCLAPTLIIARVGMGIATEHSDAHGRRSARSDGETSGPIQFAKTPARTPGDSVFVHTLESDPRTGTTTTSYALSEHPGHGLKRASEDIIKVVV